MSIGVVFAVGGVLFIVTTWATIAFALSRVVSLEEDGAAERNEVDALPRPSDT
jgi:hypothetical protein